MLKKIIVVPVALCTMLISAVTMSAANPFKDIPARHWAYTSVTSLTSKGIIEGYGDATFRGDRNITRYEAATILTKCLEKKFNLNADNKLPFSDVSEKHWACHSVKFAFENGIIKGYDDNTFRGDRYITRYEMAQMIANVLKPDFSLSKKLGKPFSDISENHWATNAVIFLASEGITEGYGDGRFRGDRNITRYEAATLIAKAMSKR